MTPITHTLKIAINVTYCCFTKYIPVIVLYLLRIFSTNIFMTVAFHYYIVDEARVIPT